MHFPPLFQFAFFVGIWEVESVYLGYYEECVQCTTVCAGEVLSVKYIVRDGFECELY